MKVTCDLKTATTSQSNLGKALGLSRQRISQLVQEDVMSLDENGNLLIVESIINYVKLKGFGTSENNRGESAPDFIQEKALHERTKREIAELKLAKMEGKLYDSRTVEMVMVEMLANLRTQLLGLPTKLAPILEGLSKEEIYNVATREIEDKLLELSEYSPEMFQDDEYLGGDSDEDG